MRTKKYIDQWAADRGYRIISRSSPWFQPDPFGPLSGRGRVIYRLTMIDRKDQIVRAWARCGSLFGGAYLAPDVVEVLLDEVDDGLD